MKRATPISPNCSAESEISKTCQLIEAASRVIAIVEQKRLAMYSRKLPSLRTASDRSESASVMRLLRSWLLPCLSCSCRPNVGSKRDYNSGHAWRNRDEASRCPLRDPRQHRAD